MAAEGRERNKLCTKGAFDCQKYGKGWGWGSEDCPFLASYPAIHSNSKSNIAGRINDREPITLARPNKMPTPQANFKTFEKWKSFHLRDWNTFNCVGVGHEKLWKSFNSAMSFFRPGNLRQLSLESHGKWLKMILMTTTSRKYHDCSVVFTFLWKEIIIGLGKHQRSFLKRNLIFTHGQKGMGPGLRGVRYLHWEELAPTHYGC